MDESKSKVWPKARLFLAGYCSGAALVLAGHPFDTTKVRLQSAGSSSLFSGPLECVKQTLRSEGIRGLYKGMTPPLLFTGVINSALFTMQALTVNALAADASRPKVSDAMRAALVTGAAISVLVTPMECVKAKLQVQYNSGVAKYANPIDCVRQLLRADQGGLRAGLYRGFAPTVFCRMSNYAYFGGYALMMRLLGAIDENGNRRKLSLGSAVLSGGGAGVFYWLSCYPMDVVKNRMQSTHEYPTPYTSVRATIATIWSRQGWRGFFRGFAPCLLRSVPANGAAFVAYEAALAVLPP
jgi:solute carrier family 25 (mitochondrial carnitine/acylcarnitine transporter), member 20/29